MAAPLPPPESPVEPGSEVFRETVIRDLFHSTQTVDITDLQTQFGTPVSGSAEDLDQWEADNEEAFREGPYAFFIYLTKLYGDGLA